MVLPLYLAVTAAEISAVSPLPDRCAYMACHFSPYTKGLSNIPDHLPDRSILILNDRMPCQGHSPDLVAEQLRNVADQLQCESVLLDFQRPPEPESEAIVKAIIKELSCPVAVTEAYAKSNSCPVFLSPAPLHQGLRQHITPWKDREIWLEAALCQEEVIITKKGTETHPIFPTEQLTGGFYDEELKCRYRAAVSEQAVKFTLYDTPESLKEKLKLAHTLGISRAVGLYQELGTFI